MATKIFLTICTHFHLLLFLLTGNLYLYFDVSLLTHLFYLLPPLSPPLSPPLESLMVASNETLEVLAIKELHSRLDDNKDGQVDYEESTEVGNLPICFLVYSQI